MTEILFNAQHMVLWPIGLLALIALLIFRRSSMHSKRLSKKANRLTQEVHKHRNQLTEQNKLLSNYIEQLEDTQSKLTLQLVFRERLMGMITHDLMGSLHSIKSFSEVIEPDRIPHYSSELSAMMKISERVHENMSTILSWVKTQRQEMVAQNETICCHELVQNIIDTLMLREEAIGFEFNNLIDGCLHFYTDKVMVHSIINNLLENQVKHSKPGKVFIQFFIQRFYFISFPENKRR